MKVIPYRSKRGIDRSLEGPYELTEEMFEFYRFRVVHWLDTFGLKNWVCAYQFRAWDEASENNLAGVGYNSEARVATFYLIPLWKCDRPDPREIDICAFHEVWEVFLADICYLIKTREFSEFQIEKAVHTIIRTMENVVYDRMLTEEDKKLLNVRFKQEEMISFQMSIPKKVKKTKKSKTKGK